MKNAQGHIEAEYIGENNSEGEDKMDNSAIGAGQAAVYASLMDTIRAGRYGYGGAGEGGCVGGPYATLSALRADILANRDIGNTGIENLQREFSSATTRELISSGSNRICDKIAETERRTDDKIAALVDKQHDADIRNVEQFCTLKANQASIEAKIDANQKFNELFAENQALKTQVACGCTTGCSTPCNSHHRR